MKTILLVLGILGVNSLLQAQILPKNDLHLQDDLFTRNANLDEEQFEKITNDIIQFFKPIVAIHGADLVLNNYWLDPTVNASAEQIDSEWHVNMYGGLARRPEVTNDGFALVVCHELGHHLGGYFFYPDRYNQWASSEGQSDYWATQVCARAIWGQQLQENAHHRDTVHPAAKQKCDKIWRSEQAQNLCYRIANAGQSLANLLAVLGDAENPSFETPDQSVVTRSSPYHPDAQCRLDTYFAGGLCPLQGDLHYIVGRELSVQNSLEAEEISAQFSCISEWNHFELGSRPKCWFRALKAKSSDENKKDLKKKQKSKWSNFVSFWNE